MRPSRVAAIGLFTFLAIAVVVGAVIVLQIRAAAQRREQDEAAQALLLRGVEAAESIFDCDYETGFTCFDADTAEQVDPATTWNELPVGSTEVSVVSVRQRQPLPVLVTQSESGAFFCIAHDGSGRTGGDSFGRVDAATFAECTGGWET